MLFVVAFLCQDRCISAYIYIYEFSLLIAWIHVRKTNHCSLPEPEELAGTGTWEDGCIFRVTGFLADLCYAFRL